MFKACNVSQFNNFFKFKVGPTSRMLYEINVNFLPFPYLYTYKTNFRTGKSTKPPKNCPLLVTARGGNNCLIPKRR